jgi:hypothetical protein
MCPILDGYGVTGTFNSRTRPRVNRVLRDQLAGDALNLVAYRLRCIIFATWLAHPATDSPVSVSRHFEGI